MVRSSAGGVGLLAALCACASPLASHAPQIGGTVGQSSAPKSAFDAGAAYAEFEETVRGAYAYLDRDDFSVEAQLAHTRQLALRTSDPETLRAVLHRTTFAFTDPHFIVGPLQDSDPNVFPTSADLVIGIRDSRFLVVDVRQGSPADDAGVRPGWKRFSTSTGRVGRTLLVTSPW